MRIVLGANTLCSADMEPGEELRKVRVLVIGDNEVGKNRLIDKFTCAGEGRASTLSTIGMYCGYMIITAILTHWRNVKRMSLLLCQKAYNTLVAVGIDVQYKTVCVDDKTVRLYIW